MLQRLHLERHFGGRGGTPGQTGVEHQPLDKIEVPEGLAVLIAAIESIQERFVPGERSRGISLGAVEIIRAEALLPNSVRNPEGDVANKPLR